MKRMLLMSSSRKGSMGYLEHAGDQFNAILQGKIKKVVLIPYASVVSGFDALEAKVKPAYEKLGVEVTSIHHFDNAAKAVEQAEALAVAGGNTFALLRRIYDNKLIDVVRERVNGGMPYMGWSAGSNVAGPTIRTTNDMPIVQPPSFDAFNLVPFQLNPHFIPGKPVGHNGESREERLEEFLVYNKGENVVAIREGSALLVEGDKATLMGEFDGLIFKLGKVETIAAGSTFVMKNING